MSRKVASFLGRILNTFRIPKCREESIRAYERDMNHHLRKDEEVLTLFRSGSLR